MRALAEIRPSTIELCFNFERRLPGERRGGLPNDSTEVLDLDWVFMEMTRARPLRTARQAVASAANRHPAEIEFDSEVF
ncbi:hypothetical protein SB912_31450, partial [Pantoea sp. SIMBA_072]